MNRSAKTVAEYLSGLPEDRRAPLEAVRAVIRKNLDPKYEEGMQYGMIGYYVPHSVYPPGYHCDPKQPLPFGGLASQKGHMSLYLGCVYGDPGHARWFQQAWAKTGKKLDMGKACIRFKKLDDLALDVIGEVVKRIPAAAYIASYEAMKAAMGTKSAAPGQSSAKKVVKKSGGKTSTRKAASTASKKTAKKAPSKKSASRR